jgi:hypothetical protein
MAKRIGTIIHGALGDCYNQLTSIKCIRSKNPGEKWVGFFAVKERMEAMLHFNLDMLDEIYNADAIQSVPVDEFYQFQINDVELREELLDKLPDNIRCKFNFSANILPWHNLRLFDFNKSGLGLELSEAGAAYLPVCYELNELSERLFANKFTIGYLWRYRSKGGAVSALFQRPQEWILRTKSELFNELISKYNAHIIIAGMAKASAAHSSEIRGAQRSAGVVDGEFCKYTDARFDLPDDSCTYLKGLGYAAEMEIMLRCDLLLMMPSGFSEPLWMRRKTPVVLIDPPPAYIAMLWKHKMPFFNNMQFSYSYYYLFVQHNKNNVLNFLARKRLLQKSSSAANNSKVVCL